MKPSISLLLLLYLNGCSLIQPIIHQSSSRSGIRIASDIPASERPCIPVQTSKQSELVVRENIFSEVAVALSSENFAQLEMYYSSYRQNTSRTASGVWKLWFFYMGIVGADPSDYKSEENWVKAQKRAFKWIKAYPQSPVPYIFYSKLLLRRAHSFRGGGYAKDVSPKVWEIFDENVSLARDVLEKSKEVASTDPEWYATMVEVAKLQSWSKKEVKNLLYEALSKEPYYHGIYFEGFSYLLPKWHGSFDEAEQFATDAVAITRKCEGQGMYARIYWSGITENLDFTEQSSDSEQVSSKKMSQINWKKMSQGFEDIVARHPNPWNITSYAKLSCLARDKAKSKELFSKIGSRLIEEAGESYPQVSLLNCKIWSVTP